MSRANHVQSRRFVRARRRSLAPAPEEQMTGVLMIQTMLDLAKGGQFKQLAYQAIVGK